jgi:hypothetical protein
VRGDTWGFALPGVHNLSCVSRPERIRVFMRCMTLRELQVVETIYLEEFHVSTVTATVRLTVFVASYGLGQ